MVDSIDLEVNNIKEVVANKILEEIREEVKRSDKIDPSLASDIMKYDPRAGGLTIKTDLPEAVSREMDRIVKKVLEPNSTDAKF